MALLTGLSKREREIVEIVFRLGETTARTVQETLNDGTSYSAVRTFLSLLEGKGLLTHRVDGQRYVWAPASDPEAEGTALIAEATRTFFKGSTTRAIAALIENDERPLSDDEIDRLRALIERARTKGR